MKNKEMFIKALNTLFWSFGSDPPAEVIWGANELLEWFEVEYGVTLKHRFVEDLDMMEAHYEAVVNEIRTV